MVLCPPLPGRTKDYGAGQRIESREYSGCRETSPESRSEGHSTRDVTVRKTNSGKSLTEGLGTVIVQRTLEIRRTEVDEEPVKVNLKKMIQSDWYSVWFK